MLRLLWPERIAAGKARPADADPAAAPRHVMTVCHFECLRARKFEIQDPPACRRVWGLYRKAGRFCVDVMPDGAKIFEKFFA
jgi:hypothetical protein